MYLRSLHVYHKFIIMGDLNFPYIDRDTITGSNRFSSLFCDLTFDLNLSQLIHHPTHIKGNILDLVLTNDYALISDVEVDCDRKLFLSFDHFPIYFSIISQNVKHVSPKQNLSYIFKKGNLNGLCDFFLDCNFDFCYTSTNINLIWSELKQIITSAFANFIPVWRNSPHNAPKWFNSNVRHNLNCIHSLRRKYKNNPNILRKQKLEHSELLLQSIMSSAKSTFEETLIKDCAYSNSNKLFDYIRSLTNSSSIPHTVYFENQSAATDKDKASMFNSYFHSVMTRSDFALPSPCDLPVLESSLVNITILDSEVYDALISLDETKAMGIDGIPPIILKHCALAPYKPFHQLFSLCLKQGCLPSEWKVHHITPVPKSGDLTSVKNYRPITLLCTISKVLEHLVYNKVIDFLSRSLYSKQFGFIKNSSCLQNLLLFLTNIYHSHDRKMQTDVIYTLN